MTCACPSTARETAAASAISPAKDPDVRGRPARRNRFSRQDEGRDGVRAVGADELWHKNGADETRRARDQDASRIRHKLSRVGDAARREKNRS